jgi:transposase
MRSTAAQSVGVDISKDALDVAIHPGGESFRITNNPEGHRALIKRLKGFDIARIVFEATGAYHRLLQQTLVKAGLPWVKVNPRQARRFAQATGKLAKTDRCDALVLARMGTALDLQPRAPVSKTVEALKELVNARDALIKDRVAALNRQAIAVSPLIKRQLAQRLRQIDGQIEAIDKRPPASQTGSLHARLNAIRCNPEFKTKYQAMIKAGKPAKVAIVAIMRKLLILANALIRGQRKWTPTAP